MSVPLRIEGDSLSFGISTTLRVKRNGLRLSVGTPLRIERDGLSFCVRASLGVKGDGLCLGIGISLGVERDSFGLSIRSSLGIERNCLCFSICATLRVEGNGFGLGVSSMSVSPLPVQDVHIEREQHHTKRSSSSKANSGQDKILSAHFESFRILSKVDVNVIDDQEEGLNCCDRKLRWETES